MSGVSVRQMFVAAFCPVILGPLGLSAICVTTWLKKNNFPQKVSSGQKTSGSRSRVPFGHYLFRHYWARIWRDRNCNRGCPAHWPLVVPIFIKHSRFTPNSMVSSTNPVSMRGVQTAVVSFGMRASAVVGLYLTETQLPQQLRPIHPVT